MQAGRHIGDLVGSVDAGFRGTRRVCAFHFYQSPLNGVSGLGIGHSPRDGSDRHRSQGHEGEVHHCVGVFQHLNFRSRVSLVARCRSGDTVQAGRHIGDLVGSVDAGFRGTRRVCAFHFYQSPLNGVSGLGIGHGAGDGDGLLS